MDTAVVPDEGYIGESERRRENRLTSIIDQLLSNKANQTFDDVIKAEKKPKGKYRRDLSTPLVKSGEVTVSTSATSERPVQPSVPDNPKNENGMSDISSNKARTPLSSKARRKKITRISGAAPTPGVKVERSSPDMETGTGSSRSGSPYSPISNTIRTPRPPTTTTGHFSPADRFSPANNNNNNNTHHKLMSEGLHMSRNYSDFMRSLAAKYNHSNPNDYRTNNLISLLDSRSSCKELVSGEGSSQAFLSLPLSSFASGAAASLASSRKHFELAMTANSKKKDDFPIMSPLCGLAQDPNAHPSSTPGMPAMDMSSTQALLNIVRSASARAHQLDTYFGGTAITAGSKRPMEVTGLQTPLDLSASMVKRPCIDPTTESMGTNRMTERTTLRSPATTESDSMKDNSHYYQGNRASSTFMTDVIAACYTHAAQKKEAVVLQSSKIAAAPLSATCRLNCAAQHTCSPTAAEVREWSIAHVVDFVKSIDLCTEYAQVFEEHSIDGSTLPLLTEEHLTTNLNMKLGPALKLKSVLAKKIGHCAVCLHCVHCHGEAAARASPTAVQNPQNGQDLVEKERVSPAADYK